MRVAVPPFPLAMSRPRLLPLFLVLALGLAQAAAAQESSPPLETPLLAEFAVGPAIVGGGPWVPSTSGILLGIVWRRFQQEKGYRLGLAASRADITDALPSSPTEGLVRARNASLLFVASIRSTSSSVRDRPRCSARAA